MYRYYFFALRVFLSFVQINKGYNLSIYFRVVGFTLIFLGVVFCETSKETNLNIVSKEIEKELQTPEGQKYFDSASVYFAKRHLNTFQKCSDSIAKPDTATMEVFLMLNRRGGVKNLFLNPETNLGPCLIKEIQKDNFSPPPDHNYWLRFNLGKQK